MIVKKWFYTMMPDFDAQLKFAVEHAGEADVGAMERDAENETDPRKANVLRYIIAEVKKARPTHVDEEENEEEAQDEEEDDVETMKISELRAAIIALVGATEFEKKRFVEKAEMRSFLREERMKKAFEKKKDDALKKGIALVPAGKYILGDPCYAARDVHDLDFFQKTYYDKEDDDDDDDDSDDDEGPPRFTDGTPVTAFNTASPGPAWFTDKKEKMSVRINGSVLALVPFAYNPHFTNDGDVAHVVQFNDETTCFAKRGVIHFGDIAFNTNKPIPVDDMFETSGDKKKDGGGKKKKTTATPKNKTKKTRCRDDDDDDDEDDDYEPPKKKKTAEKKRKDSDTELSDDEPPKKKKAVPKKKKAVPNKDGSDTELRADEDDEEERKSTLLNSGPAREAG